MADITAFFDAKTSTVSYVVADPASGAAAIVDPVLDYHPRGGRSSAESAEKLIEFIDERKLRVAWLLETHIHADHVSAASFLKKRIGGEIAIGADVSAVAENARQVFNLRFDRSGFDRLVRDGDRLPLGTLSIEVLHTPGHTPDCVSYRIGNAVFCGDTLFMPDYGTARCDFPGGSARQLYRSIRRLLALPPETRIFVGHDYAPNGRAVAWEASVAEHRAGNLHIRDGVGEDEFVAMREDRDAKLDLPELILPALQLNLRAGRFPPPEENGTSYLKIPLNRF